MEPLSALSLAGNIVQFVEFACKLIGSTREIYHSASGTTKDSQHLQGIYERLVSYEAQLDRQPQVRSQENATTPVSTHTDALGRLLDSCKQECSLLLSITSKMRASENSKGRLRDSFRKAMLEIWHKDEVTDLQNRLRDYQTDIIIRLCAIAKENTDQITKNVQQITSEVNSLRTERLVQFDHLDSSLRDVSNQVRLISTRVCKPNGKGIIRSCTDDEFHLLIGKVSQLALTERSLAQEEAMLRSLNYDQRPVRYETIPDAHIRTFKWIFHQGPTGHGFTEWLENGKDIYWVTGKPGSGKSTLMKYILHHPTTTKHLSSWSPNSRFIVASHFFWSAGLPIQRSREGLLRSLLYDILSRVPELISDICKENPTMFDQGGRMVKPWSIKWLEDVLRQVVTRKELPVKFCFFIDGLDEFEGDSFDVCRTLLDLCSSPDIKICVASRPWNVFETCLEATEANRLHVHELTQDDISNYVDSELRDHPKWNLSVTEAVEVPKLISEITNRAEGVFLWVFLVTRMLRDGLMNDDTLAELRMRLDSVPTDLEKFFKHILESVEPFYHEKQSRTLQVAMVSDGPLHAHIYSFHDLEYTYENYAIDHTRQPLDQHDLYKFHIPVARRLNGRCKGLLEVRRQKVEFLHRTVRDFLRTREMVDFLRSKTNESFNPYLSILRAHIAWLKSRLLTRDFRQDNPNNLSFIATLSRILDYAQATEEQNNRCGVLCSELLDDLELSIQTLILTRGSPISSTDPEGSDRLETANKFQLIFRQAVIQKQLAHFVSTKLDKDLDYFGDLEKGPLLLALESYTTKRDDCSVLGQCDEEYKSGLPKSTKLLQILLQNNWDPNKKFILNPANGFTTPWSEFMSCIVPWHCNRDLNQDLAVDVQECFLYALKSGIFHSLLRHKADPNARLPNWQRDNTTDNSPTIGTIWIFLGLKVDDLWTHGELYLRELKAMINAGADFEDLELGGTFQLEAEEEAPTIEYIAERNGGRYANREKEASIERFDHEFEIWKEINAKEQERFKSRNEKGNPRNVMQTRWGLVAQELGGGGIPGKQLFQARLIAELAKADQKKFLRWSDLEPVFQTKFPKSISQIALKAIQGNQVMA
ncbi:hypothetical protein F5Y19DRAFT_333100 [Xylariaceae sp. FL1651]|nr:hypothetical protein F5Y19DRAFT_333100 [Xylariaceae sp. FL1651]